MPPSAVYFVYLQVNPEFRIYLDADCKVVAIEAINEDAKVLFDAHYSVYEGTFEDCLNTILQDAEDGGYLKKGANFQGDMIGKEGAANDAVPEQLRQQTEQAVKNYSDNRKLELSGNFACGIGGVNSHDPIDLADSGNGYGHKSQGGNGQQGDGSGGRNDGGGTGVDPDSREYADLLQKAGQMIGGGNVADFRVDENNNVIWAAEEDSAGNRFEYTFTADGTQLSRVQTHQNGQAVDPNGNGQQTGDAGGNGGNGSGSNGDSGNSNGSGNGDSGNSGSGGNEGWGAGGSSSGTTPSGPPQGNPVTSEVLSKHANGVPAVEKETWADGAYRETTRYEDGRYNTITEVWADGWTYTWVYYTADEGGRVKTYTWWDPHNNVNVRLDYNQEGTYAEGYRGKNKWYQWYNEKGICIKDVYDQGFLYTEIYFDPSNGQELERYETNHNTGGSFHEYYTADRKYRITEHFNSSGKLWEKVTYNMATGEVTSERY
ncbi:MAG: hypothetical protein E7223_01205 [Clostridiales bacterium]|nr:hypothetical protein [Clostridiales bacterium]